MCGRYGCGGSLFDFIYTRVRQDFDSLPDCALTADQVASNADFSLVGPGFFRDYPTPIREVAPGIIHPCAGDEVQAYAGFFAQ